MIEVVLVIGYNNTRINDVLKIRKIAFDHFGKKTVLCKRAPNAQDFAAADYVIDVRLDGSDDDTAAVLEYAKNNDLSIVGLLPFSDTGVPLGGKLAKYLNIRGPHPELAKGGLDKHYFRTLEAADGDRPPGYRPVMSVAVGNFDELVHARSILGDLAFLKPAKEGNSRGCTELTSSTNLLSVWKDIEKYKEGGIVLEEMIDGEAEFSWDHVSGYEWITAKWTSKSQYRAEYQEIVPAAVDVRLAQAIGKAGSYMRDLVGHAEGACHNELFVLKDGISVSGVEPNLRPAGGRIWDLAALSFENFDPWKTWISWSLGVDPGNPRELLRTHYSGIRFLEYPMDGIFEKVKSFTPAQLVGDRDVELIELVWTKLPGESVKSMARDGSDYVGYIILRSLDYKKLEMALERCSKLLHDAMLRSINSTPN